MSRNNDTTTDDTTKLNGPIESIIAFLKDTIPAFAPVGILFVAGGIALKFPKTRIVLGTLVGLVVLVYLIGFLAFRNG